MAVSLVPELGIRNNTYYYHTSDGYYFHKYKEVGNASYYRCTTGTCDARGILRSHSRDFELRYGHNHCPCPEFIEYMRQRRHLIIEAGTMTDSDAMQLFSPDRNFPFQHELTLESLRTSIQRERLSNVPEEPISIPLLNDILAQPLFQSVLCSISDGNEPLYKGSRRSNDGTTVILLMSGRCSEVLKAVPSLYAFTLTLPIKDTPSNFQIHVIGTLLDGYSVPLAFLLLERDTSLAYTCGLSLLRDKITAWNFRSVVVSCNDNNIRDSYRQVFAINIDISLDHYILEIGKLVKNLLPMEKLNELETMHFLQLCVGLPMVPQNLLECAINVLKTEIFKRADDVLRHIFGLILLNIEMRWIRCPIKGPMFSASGNREKTSDAMETLKGTIMNHIPYAGTGLYTYLRAVRRIEGASGETLTKMRTAQRSTQRRYSLSEDAEIVALTNILIRFFGDFATPLQNLMKVVATKRWHVFLKSQQ
ncbi:putative phosphoserine aminotransferase [Frankliniella fusca]|uniref:Phosphoserine aminotransferase n=1 Tax=Frankliniella fusca TaxID=407009 RepID=A0AAE1HK12_9NEOP|nr:putative phosphoserine aminotransferase [Frankliniella fusca]